ncbi:Tat pathway signal sequence domain protein [Streptomyces sp. NPDC003327]
MYEIVRRHLGKVVAGTAMAVTGTAAAVAISLPGTVSAVDGAPGRTGSAAPGAATGGGNGEAGAGAGTGAAAGAGAGAQARGATPPPATVAPPAREGTKGVGTDPLTDDELARAEALALTPPAAAPQQDVAGGRGPQHLGTELADPLPGQDGVRRAEVRFYDYGTDALLTRTVNLATGKVERTTSQRGVQPSAHPEELREALELILASPLGKGVKEDYKDATGKELTSTGQLWFNGDVYRPYRERNVPDQLARCGEHRCVRLVTKVLNGAWIDTRDIVVDLSTRAVVRVG